MIQPALLYPEVRTRRDYWIAMYFSHPMAFPQNAVLHHLYYTKQWLGASADHIKQQRKLQFPMGLYYCNTSDELYCMWNVMNVIVPNEIQNDSTAIRSHSEPQKYGTIHGLVLLEAVIPQHALTNGLNAGWKAWKAEGTYNWLIRWRQTVGQEFNDIMII